MTAIEPHPTGPTWEDALQWERVSDSLSDETEYRIVALERALVDWRYRRRLRREIRRAAKAYDWAGPAWEDWRIEAAWAAWLLRRYGGSR